MSPEVREAIDAIAERRRILLESLVSNPSGLAWCELHTRLADEVASRVYQDMASRHPQTPALAVIATGGYGRKELSPHSDIDITVVPADEASVGLDAAIRELYHSFHAAFSEILGLSVGYAYRLVSDAPGLDARTRTGLMDMRLVAGSFDVFRALESALIESFSAGQFVLSKVTEREEMFAKTNDTPLAVEPNLKDGAGGVRCFHCSNWLREAVGERAVRAPRSFDTIVRYRNLLHLHVGKSQDVLTRQRQAEIAERFGLDLYGMMSEVAAAGSELHSYYRRATEKLGESRFRLSPGLLAVHGEARPYGDLDGGIAAVGIALATQLGLKVSDIGVPSPKSLDGPAALFAVSRGEGTLRNLDRCGLLAHLIPELTACRFLMPTDTVHAYTVFEHTLRAVRMLDEADSDPFLSGLKASITDLEPLYLAMLLHDVGKVDSTRPHSAVGAEMAREICLRWGIASGTRESVEWLVREHLTMARFLRVRDIMLPQTIEEFSSIVGTADRLHMLTLLTWADIQAVAPGVWTPAQGTFMRELHGKAEARLATDQELVAPDPALQRKRLLKQLQPAPEDEEALQQFVASLPVYYLTSTPPEIVRLHLDFFRKAQAGMATVELFARPELSATEITVCTLDQPGLLSRLLGVFYAFDLSVSEIRAGTTATTPAVALDVFTVSFGGRPVPHATGSQVASTVHQVLRGEKSVEELLVHGGKDPARKQNVFSHTYIPGNPGILEIRAPRGRGMAYRFSRLIAGQNWNVLAARVGQWAGNATAAFYLQRQDGGAVDSADVADVLSNLSPTLRFDPD